MAMLKKGYLPPSIHIGGLSLLYMILQTPLGISVMSIRNLRYIRANKRSPFKHGIAHLFLAEG
jgi:hypothetical protein